ncbi:MAG: lysophospholipase [Desulfovibrionales bacterium]|nr:lysophospholipase [Desulfovibrionales bacterium]
MNTRPAIGLMALTFLLMACGHPVFYQPRPYQAQQLETFEKQPGATALTYETDQGIQTAFYLPGKTAGKKLPEHIWLIFSGIGSLALDWLPWLVDPPRQNIAFLLIDYPGYGNSHGVARAKRILANSHGALNALTRHLNVDQRKIEKRMGILGHSLGAGTALQFSVEVEFRKLILVSPFTDLKDAVRHRYGGFWGGFLNLINPEKYDNRTCLDQLAARPHPPKIIIFHGDADKVIPVEMGRELAQRHGKITTLYELKEFGHKNFFSTHMDKIYEAMEF